MTTHNYEIGDIASLTGLASVSMGSPVVNGSGTLFLTETRPGYVIQIGGVWRRVLAVTSHTLLTCETAWPTTLTGQPMTVGRTVNLGRLPTPVTAPRSEPTLWVESVLLGDGSSRALGAPTTTWRWGFLQVAQRDQLRAYCPAKSAIVVIRTKSPEGDAYAYYRGRMIWPDGFEQRQAGRRIEFSLLFRALEALGI